jgi:type IV pilus assembly protein PilW
MHKRISLRKSDLGFSLVELLVATAITLISLLIIVQVFSVYDGWKRTTTGTAQSQENGLLGAFSIERDLRHAGFGMIGLGCPTINAYTLLSPALSPSAQPVFRSRSLKTIPRLVPTNDQHPLQLIAFRQHCGRLQAAMADSGAYLIVDNGIGFNQGDMVLLSQPPKDCSILQLSQDATGATGLHGSATLPRCPVESTSRTYSVPCRRVLGVPAAPRFSISASWSTAAIMCRTTCCAWMKETWSLATTIPSISFPAWSGCGRVTAATPIPPDGVLDVFDNDTAALILAGVNGEYPGRGADQPDRSQRQLGENRGQPGGHCLLARRETLAIAPDDRHYRYRVFQTVVPLKNMIWNN